jgi:hypothetical protein
MGIDSASDDCMRYVLEFPTVLWIHLRTSLSKMTENSVLVRDGISIRARPPAHARAPRGGARARGRRTIAWMVRCRLIVLILLLCAVADGRVSNIVCGDCDASPAGCSKGCPVEPIEEELTESIVGAMVTQVPPIEVAIEEPPIEVLMAASRAMDKMRFSRSRMFPSIA